MKNIGKYLMIFGLAAICLSVASCQKEDPYKGNDQAPVIKNIYLEDGQSSVYDRLVEYARLGQTIRLDGENLLGVVEVYINGYQILFNQTFQTNNSMIVNINTRVPVRDVDPAVKDKVRVVKRNGKEATFDFVIRAAAPSISDISHTMARAGEVIVIKGTNLHEATEVVFPGGVTGTDISSDDEEGDWVIVTVPSGVTGSGSVKVTGSNGSASSAPYFNFKEGILHNFDDVNNKAHTPGMDDATLSDAVIPAQGDGPKSQGVYQVFNSTGSMGAADQRYWLNSTNVEAVMMAAIPSTTSADMCGIQIDIYVDGAWTSGEIRMVVADGMGETRGCMVYAPIAPNYPEGGSDPNLFVNPGSWFTITLPFSLSADYGGKTFSDVLGTMSVNPDWGGKFKQMGPWFDNQPSRTPGQTNAEQKIYFDNIRIVPLNVPATSDYPDEEEEVVVVEE